MSCPAATNSWPPAYRIEYLAVGREFNLDESNQTPEKLGAAEMLAVVSIRPDYSYARKFRPIDNISYGVASD